MCDMIQMIYVWVLGYFCFSIVLLKNTPHHQSVMKACLLLLFVAFLQFQNNADAKAAG